MSQLAMDLPTISELPDLLPFLTLQEREEADRLIAEIRLDQWPAEYVNRETGRPYRTHHEAERRFVYSDAPRYALAKGGEGAGKSVAGIIKSLDRLRRGMSGIMVSPDLPHFKKSLWPEFRRWCPWDQVVESQRYRANTEWTPREAFEMVFNNGTVLICGGIESPMSWEGPNVNFAMFDEARRSPDAAALKVLDGRIRIAGPQGEPPQLFLTTTPRMNWLHDYFGPIKDDDPRADFKRDMSVTDLLTIDNERAGNVVTGFTQDRAKSLTSAEARVLLEAAWEDIDDVTHFLPSMMLWDACREDLPPLTEHEPLLIVLDGADVHDSFGMIGITAHPTRPNCRAIRIVYEWTPPLNGIIDHYGDENNPGPYWIIKNVIAPRYALFQVSFDPAGLYQLANRLMAEGIVQCVPFTQQGERLIADKLLFDDIVSRNIWHDGNPALRRHIENADRKPDPQSRKLRIVKRVDALKIDLAVCASMGNKVAVDVGIGA